MNARAGIRQRVWRWARVALTGLLLLATLPVAATQDESVPASGYYPQAGEQFFLLSDASYASDEVARVRLEAPGRDYRRYTMEGYGGADIRVYRVPDPLAFLQKQKNLHRLQTEANFRGEGLANALAYLWDNWYRQSRRAMQKAFSYEARKTVTEHAPALSLGDTITEPTRYTAQPQFAPIQGLQLVDQFRYPLWDAKPIEPPKDVELAGSSSEFIAPADGNVYIPVGKREPGLYIVEALIGNYRATTALFVSDTVAITKIAGNDLLVWTARKHEGTAVAGARLLWTDGVGVLTRAETDAQGLARLSHLSPERSYVLGQDADGGVFVSENFYYDSEIYNTKLYAFTDRPLYRPGDWVEVKVLGREFKNARESVLPAAGPISLTVIDANGTTLQTLERRFDGLSGSAARFQLPDNATAGGYELRLGYQGQLYSSAFRVAEYIKPHFEIVLDLAKPDYRTGEAVEGQLSLLYPDGKPVQNAKIDISLRAQQLSMVDNELQYLGQFPVELQTATLSSDSEGHAALSLPKADKPSRYLLTVFASDGAAFRVKTSKEILIERGAAQYRLESDRRFSAAGDSVAFRYRLEGQGEDRPTRYEWIRLEDQSTGGGSLSADSASFEVEFEKPGTYNLSLRDDQGMILGATGHAVSGDGVKASPGSIEIVFDRAEYQAGDVAEALITFPEPVKDALLTLERDQVEATALISEGADWLQLKHIADTQYRARIPVAEHFAPNLTFSVLYTKAGDYSFQNAGIRVTVPSIAVDIKTDREVYKPGEMVQVELSTQFAGKPVPARLTVSVVDEMIYALQPEIAPAIGDFFYHPRRNNVRTSASLAFISYDVALPGALGAPEGTQRSERGVKVLERPRREEKDTAAWEPDLVTGADGKARFSFRMPDSLTRWRITARAINADGVVGQRQSFLRSEQALYLKWTGPTRFRTGDQPALGVLAFNQGQASVNAELAISWGGEQQRQPVSLPPGVSYWPVPLAAIANGALTLSLNQGSAVADSLQVALRADGAGWQQLHSIPLTLSAQSTAIELPADATGLSLRLSAGAADWYRASLDDLIEYPWGCVEQTASRLLPLSLAFPSMAGGEARIVDRLRLTLQQSRLRLVHMAGPNARFSWWGQSEDEDAFLTGYAYYADWYASRALGLSLPPEHWQRVLELYAERAEQTPLLQRVLILDFAHTMELPIKSLLTGVLDQLADAQSQRVALDAVDSLVLHAPDSELGVAMARVLASRLAAAARVPVPVGVSSRRGADETLLGASALPLARAALWYRGTPDAAQAQSLFAELAPEQATLDRALVLTWLGQGAGASDGAASAALSAPWALDDAAGSAQRWHWNGATLPTSVELAAPPTAPLQARLSYYSAAPSGNEVPVAIRRKLWRLEQGEEAFKFTAVAVEPGEALASDRLYLDEITLTVEGEQSLRYGLVEVPLPPGAEIERTTWGVSVAGLDGEEAQALEKARFEPGQLSYGVPVDSLSGSIRFRHLLRFSQKGQFQLPPARYQRMYAPEQQAFEAPVVLGAIEVR